MATPSQKSAPAKSAAQKGAKKGSKHRRHRRNTWSVYVHRSLKQVNKALTLSGKTMKIFNSFINDIFERLATEAAHLARVNKSRTLGSRELQAAVRLTLPADLAKHAMGEATRAVANASA